jgi:hypothetical protein
MSKVSIEGNALGSGTFTIAAPNSNTSYTLTLPENTGTVVTTGGASLLTTSGNLTFTGTGNRITGDFSNATIANRVAFQTSTVNGNSQVEIIPNGTGTQSSIIVSTSSSDLANTSLGNLLAVSGSEIRLQSTIRGTGSYLPMTFFTGGSEVARFTESGTRYLRMASGTGGIQFNGDTAAANALDDYEEGSWTPVGNGVTLTSPAGIYTKIGNIVSVSAQWTYPNTADANTAKISGLPFTSNSSTANFTGAVSITSYGSDNLYVFNNTNSTEVLVRNNNNADLSNANLSQKFVTFFATYRVA